MGQSFRIYVHAYTAGRLSLKKAHQPKALRLSAAACDEIFAGMKNFRSVGGGGGGKCFSVRTGMYVGYCALSATIRHSCGLSQHVRRRLRDIRRYLPRVSASGT